MNQQFYLKPNVVIEPLVDKWYAWPHLISPATKAMNLTGRHLKIINSYVQSPLIHASAVQNSKMKGGPFMDYAEPRVAEVLHLKEETLLRCQKSMELSDAIKELDQMLKRQARGFSLESLYDRVPEILRGYVELVYDLNHHPSFRFFEALLYQSEFYDKSSQSIALWLTENDERPFCLSTPKLKDETVLELDISFDNEAIDLLSKMKHQPGSITEIATILKISEEHMELFNSFFTSQAPKKYEKYQGSKVRMRYFGHACILIETSEVSILIDPLISYYGYESSMEHYSDIDLPDVIDYVLITHNHQDHILFETLLPLRHKIKQLVVPRTTSGALQDPNLKLMFNALGFHNVVEIDEMETLNSPDCKITGVPFTGEHSDLNIKAKICYHVLIGKFSFLFVADSRVMERRLYEHVQRAIGDVDVVFLGMECDGAPLSWLYGPLLTDDFPRDMDQSRRLSGSDFNKGVSLVDIFKPKEVYVYAMGQEAWVEFISSIKYSEDSNPIVQSNFLINNCLERGIIAERLYGEKELFY
ncbi:L-ascorbate metabolism protein UlaG, beta-lactamase superfamily [Pedobacter steynii]|uniref:L-ascorbate metabolism protein UlaG, beta-lactamase superfamily n=1 Tax=Pedobacter steynii TaxID=430522 RepID=A0A1G9V951_9SPHI|nr:MBL fold metallo-hydrolase [Pedobacter steynii]NQX41017.1 MBL fold metallo-hydrolase [Pedobacter steynii]SDM68610.1 L-ascorbate metabolism protein UlaG, beta-lactamase superfamily [Pedobacter steynii]